MIRTLVLSLSLIFTAAPVTPVSAAAAAPGEPACSINSTGGIFGGTQGVVVNGRCPKLNNDGTSGPPTKVVFCGRPSSAENGLWNRQCGTPMACFQIDKATGNKIQVDAFATLTRSNGRWSNPNVWCPADALPAVDLTALRERAIRLLPRVRIGSAWTSTALVNAETVLWADTDPERSLGSATVLGRTVRLRISLERADWDFGDDTSDTVTSPGKPYDSSGDPCRTAQCPSYFGHTYRHTGPMTIRLTLTWHAQFSLDAATWTDITDPVTGPTAQHLIAVKQARGILVPNPGEH